jgi:hypothetical protein
MMALDISGQRFGRLVVVERDGSKNGKAVWRCVCDCGETTFVITSELRCGDTKSCGCQRRDVCSALGKRTSCANSKRGGKKGGASRTRHGHAKRSGGSLTYGIWEGMIASCTNPNYRRYRDYGGRGITVCDRWRVFDHFLADMGEKPDGYSLDRKNNELGYSKDNCKWSTNIEQQRNRRDNRRLSHEGSTLTVSEWAERTGLKAATIHSRLGRGWDPSRALSKRVDHANG